MKKLIKKPKFNSIIIPNFTKKQITKISKLAEKGNIHAKIDLIMHNQLVINYKLNEILDKLNKQ